MLSSLPVNRTMCKRVAPLKRPRKASTAMRSTSTTCDARAVAAAQLSHVPDFLALSTSPRHAIRAHSWRGPERCAAQRPLTSRRSSPPGYHRRILSSPRDVAALLPAAVASRGATKTSRAVHPSTVHPSTVHPSTVHPSTRPPVHPSTRPPVHPSTRPPVHPSTRPPVHPSIRPPTGRPAAPSLQIPSRATSRRSDAGKSAYGCRSPSRSKRARAPQ